jgi:hypothetical protein
MRENNLLKVARQQGANASPMLFNHLRQPADAKNPEFQKQIAGLINDFATGKTPVSPIHPCSSAGVLFENKEVECKILFSDKLSLKEDVYYCKAVLHFVNKTDEVLKGFLPKIKMADDCK